MEEAATFLFVLAVWAVIFELLRRRAGSPPMRWGWIAVIAGVAAPRRGSTGPLTR